MYTKSSHKHFKQTYGYLLAGFNLKKLGKTTAIFIPIFHMWKKAMACVALVVFLKFPSFAIMTFNQITLFSLIVEWWNWPLKDWFEQVQVIINEVSILLIVYTLFCLSEFTEVSVRMVLVGNSVLIIIFMNLIMFTSFYLWPSLNKLLHKFK